MATENSGDPNTQSCKEYGGNARIPEVADGPKGGPKGGLKREGRHSLDYLETVLGVACYRSGSSEGVYCACACLRARSLSMSTLPL